MKKTFSFLFCLIIVFSLSACNKEVKFSETENSTTTAQDSTENTLDDNDVQFSKAANNTIIAKDGTEYTFVGNESSVYCFGNREFIGHIQGEDKSFVHIFNEIKTGMYSVNGSRDVLVRYLPYDEFSAMYVKSGLLKTEVSLDNCIRFVFIKGIRSKDKEITNSNTDITDCKTFLADVKSGEKAEDAGLYDLVRQPDGKLKNCYVYGYVYGVLQEDINLVIPLKVTSFDDKAYSITIDNIEYVLPNEWADKLLS